MSEQDRAFISTFKLILGILIVMAVAFYFIAKLVSSQNDGDGGQDAMQKAAIEERIDPVGEVRIAGEPAPGGGEGAEAAKGQEVRSGKEVVTAVCAACHQAGTLGAPKIGSEGDWAPRLDKGYETLLAHTRNGFKQMPPKGGDASLTKQELTNAIVHMVRQSGLELPGAKTSTKSSSPADGSQDAGATQSASADATQDGGQASGDSDGSGGSDGGASADLAQGKKVYNSICMSCHDTGAAGAPKLDAAAWESRLDKGTDALYEHAINGFKAMPPKGGNPSLSDAEVEAAVDYMIDQVQ